MEVFPAGRRRDTGISPLPQRTMRPCAASVEMTFVCVDAVVEVVCGRCFSAMLSALWLPAWLCAGSSSGSSTGDRPGCFLAARCCFAARWLQPVLPRFQHVVGCVAACAELAAALRRCDLPARTVPLYAFSPSVPQNKTGEQPAGALPSLLSYIFRIAIAPKLFCSLERKIFAS